MNERAAVRRVLRWAVVATAAPGAVAVGLLLQAGAWRPAAGLAAILGALAWAWWALRIPSPEEAVRRWIRDGIITANEARRAQGLPPLPGPEEPFLDPMAAPAPRRPFEELDRHPDGICFRGCPACHLPEAERRAAFVRRPYRLLPLPGWRPIPPDPAEPWWAPTLRAGPPRRNGKSELAGRTYEAALRAAALSEVTTRCECVEEPAAAEEEEKLWPWRELDPRPGREAVALHMLECRIHEVRLDAGRVHFPIPCLLHPEVRP